MSSWALQPKRTLLNDPNRSRFSARDPPFENLPNSPGPAAYTPRPVMPIVKGAVKLTHVPVGMTERDRTLSNGVKVDHVLPINSLTYVPEYFPRTIKSPPQTLSPRTSPRFPKPVTDAERYAAELPGPGSYLTPTPPGRSSKWSQSKRSVCEPLVREHLSYDEPPTASKSVTPRQSRSPVQSPSLGGSLRSGLSPSPQVGHGGVSPPLKGPTIGHSPRHFNLHNPNSNVARERDPDFDNPPPGRYNNTISPKSSAATAGTKGKFSPSPRRMDMTRNVDVPGPGSYSVGGTGELFFAPL